MTGSRVAVRISLLAFSLLLMSCGGEDATPIDLDATTSTVGPLIDDDPNAESRQLVQDLAEQQCLDDPAKVEGVIRIVDPDTDEVVGEFLADCAEVRARPPAEDQ